MQVTSHLSILLVFGALRTQPRSLQTSNPASAYCHWHDSHRCVLWCVTANVPRRLHWLRTDLLSWCQRWLLHPGKVSTACRAANSFSILQQNHVWAWYCITSTMWNSAFLWALRIRINIMILLCMIAPTIFPLWKKIHKYYASSVSIETIILMYCVENCLCPKCEGVSMWNQVFKCLMDMNPWCDCQHWIVTSLKCASSCWFFPCAASWNQPWCLCPQASQATPCRAALHISSLPCISGTSVDIFTASSQPPLLLC